MALKKLFLSPGHGNYTDRLDLLEYINQVLKVNGYPSTYTCCDATSILDGQTLVYSSADKKWVPTFGGAGGATNLGYTASSTNGVITNTNGTTATLPLATAINAGLQSPASFSAANSLASASTTTQIPFGVGSNGFNSSPNFTWNNTTNELTVNGKLNVSGGIDPIYLQFVESTATLTPTGNTKGAIYVSDGTDGKIKNHLIYKSDVGILTDLLSGGTITSVFGRSTASIVATNGDYTASQITNVPSGSISSTNVQAAITELDLEKANKTLTTLTLTNTDVVAGDTLEVAIGKLQAQLDNTVVPVIDSVPTDASTNAVSSNGVFDALITKVDKPISSTPGFIATVDATGNNIEYIAAALTSIPALQADVTSGTVVANSYVQANTLKVELDKKLTKTLSDGKLFIGDVTNTAVEQTLSGDVTITNLGVSTVVSASDTVAGKVELATTAETETGTSTTLAVTPAATEATYIKKSFGDNIGDLLVWHTDNDPGILAKGATGEVLTVDPTNVLVGLSWKPNISARYVQTFVAGDFVVGATESTLTIPQTSHLMGIYPRVDADQVNGVDFEQVSVGITKKSNGDIILTVTNPNTFNGRVIIS